MTDERPTVVPDDHARFAHDDAAYLFDALSSTERVAYEAHLARCPVCAAAVAELRGTASALSALRGLPDEVLRNEASWELSQDGQAPPDLLPELIERAAAEHRRGHRRVTRTVVALAGVAAAALVAAGIALVTGPDRAEQPPTAGSVMRTVRAAVPIRATAELQSVDWGTRITLHCRYVGGSAYSPGPRSTAHYLLRVIDEAGHRHDLGSWSLRYAGGAEATFTSGTSLPRTDIRQVQVVRADHGAVLDLRP